MIADFALDLFGLVFDGLLYLAMPKGSRSLWHFADCEQTKRRRLQNMRVIRQNEFNYKA